ncbi:ANTAR domain-containing protein [Nocardia tenerifensis]|uniref:ANTAR domain-containing protein n=1 Tax=Nocardia tenerifensis TaxID=228006 RepID=A0A318JT82_9NOCA|nr:ANTAR domain-containing protein [Nocardia tenerifensis]PXX59739.1 ANTAR domain-containing protein [Nocardia tenerifensis]
MSDVCEERGQPSLGRASPDLLAARAVIEQAKGALMLVYGVDAEQAFRMLRRRSQATNVKLRALAAQLIAELPSLDLAPPELRAKVDRLLHIAEPSPSKEH